MIFGYVRTCTYVGIEFHFNQIGKKTAFVNTILHTHYSLFLGVSPT